jgi:hypothetical protein
MERHLTAETRINEDEYVSAAVGRECATIQPSDNSTTTGRLKPTRPNDNSTTLVKLSFGRCRLVKLVLVKLSVAELSVVELTD